MGGGFTKAKPPDLEAFTELAADYEKLRAAGLSMKGN